MGGWPLVVVKVHDASLVDRSVFEVRVEATAEIARVDARVCRPLPVAGRVVTALEPRDGSTALVSCCSYSDGVAPEVANGLAAVFDFDDCGYGPVAFDVANTLYMVLFNDMTARRTGAFPHFREAFLSGYRSVSGEQLSAGEVGDFIDLRVAALESWLDQPATAPVGIRTSAPEWLTTLRAFVDRYRERGRAARPGEPEG